MAQAVLTELTRTFDLRGRTARGPYLMFLGAAIVLFALCLTACAMFLPEGSKAIGVYITTALFYLPVTAAGVRRLHDVGESGLLMLDPLKPSIAAGLLLGLLWLWVSFSDAGNFVVVVSTFLFASLIYAVLIVGALVVLAVSMMYMSHTLGLLMLPSQPGANKYGPSLNEAAA
jgi:uncharacterized membrane protein YhaH (DUF805 family)